MKKLVYMIVIISLSMVLTSCTNYSTHPIVKNRTALINTEVRINIYVSDDIVQSRIDNFSLLAGNNYVKVPVGTHILYWNKKGKNQSREIIIDSSENKFIIF